MAKNYVITARYNPQKFKDSQYKDGVETYSFDLSPWAEDNNTVTTATWTVKAGQATVSGQALASNVASAQVTFGSEGGNLIQIKCATGTETYVIWLDVLAKDPEMPTDDYSYWS